MSREWPKHSSAICSGREGIWADSALGLGEDDLVVPASNTPGALESRNSSNRAHSHAITKASVFTVGYRQQRSLIIKELTEPAACRLAKDKSIWSRRTHIEEGGGCGVEDSYICAPYHTPPMPNCNLSSCANFHKPPVKSSQSAAARGRPRAPPRHAQGEQAPTNQYESRLESRATLESGGPRGPPATVQREVVVVRAAQGEAASKVTVDGKADKDRRNTLSRRTTDGDDKQQQTDRKARRSKQRRISSASKTGGFRKHISS